MLKRYLCRPSIHGRPIIWPRRIPTTMASWWQEPTIPRSDRGLISFKYDVDTTQHIPKSIRSSIQATNEESRLTSSESRKKSRYVEESDGQIFVLRRFIVHCLVGLVFFVAVIDVQRDDHQNRSEQLKWHVGQNSISSRSMRIPVNRRRWTRSDLERQIYQYCPE